MPKIKIEKDGPYIVSGEVPLKKEIIIGDEKGSTEYKHEKTFPKQEEYHLCRCGKSKEKPFCDGTHEKIKFNGTETASKEPFLKQSEKLEGPTLILRDAQELCAVARFCHNRHGNTWALTTNSDDPSSREEAIRQACKCPAGRLVIYDKKTGKPIEPKLNKEISLLEDPLKKVGGPIFVKGGIPIFSANNFQYEVRNRVTLCRCGKSNNKPFCDGTHISSGFKG
ncbi:MAG: CDGSH iron-sulfur domain-containing protein [Nanobdellota archaeon]